MNDRVLQLYSVFDTKVSAFASPFVARTKAEAIRSFQVAVGDDSLPFKKHPGDYQLFYVGGWDDQSGRVLPLEVAQRVIGADEF